MIEVENTLIAFDPTGPLFLFEWLLWYIWWKDLSFCQESLCLSQSATWFRWATRSVMVDLSIWRLNPFYWLMWIWDWLLFQHLAVNHNEGAFHFDHMYNPLPTKLIAPLLGNNVNKFCHKRSGPDHLWSSHETKMVKAKVWVNVNFKISQSWSLTIL